LLVVVGGDFGALVTGGAVGGGAVGAVTGGACVTGGDAELVDD